jgi:large subunit ribosomal protein L17
MRHQRAGKKLGRDAAHRKALYANLAGSLIEHGRIKTTVTKAKAVKPIAEQMITLGRRGDLHARRQATAFLRSRDVVHHLFAVVAPRFEGRPGGYTRIVKIGPRPGDAAEMVYLELVDEAVQPRPARRAAAPAAEAVPAEPAEAEVEAPETEAEAAEDPEAAAEIAEEPEAEAAAEPADLEEPVDATAEAPAGEPPVVEATLEAEPAGDEPTEPEAAGDEAAGDEPTTPPTA